MFKRSPNFPLEKQPKIWMVNQLLIGLCLTLPCQKYRSYERSRHSLKSATINQYAIVTFEEVIVGKTKIKN
jgi:hypothetical protein